MSISKSKYNLNLTLFSTILFLFGAIWRLFAPKTVYDLPALIMMIGAILAISTIFSTIKLLGAVSLSNKILAILSLVLFIVSIALTQIPLSHLISTVNISLANYICLGVGIVACILMLLALLGLKKYPSEEKISFTRKAIWQIFTNNAIMIFLFIMIIIICIIEPRFMQVRVLLDILTQSSPKLVIALGIAFALLIGGTDLSAGRMVGLAAVISTSMLQNLDYGNRFFPDLPIMPVIIPIIIALAACLLFGGLNGWLVAQFGMHPFIATLATQVIVYGATSLYFDLPPNNSQPIGGVDPRFTQIGLTKFFTINEGGVAFPGISILIPIAAVICLLVWFLMNKTTFGKNVYAIGGNKEAAVVSGVNVFLTIVGVFMLGAVMYGFGGILEAARTAGATNNYGLGYETDAIAACVVGGVSLNGGVGKVSGIVSGVLIFTVIQYGLQFIGISPMWQQVIKGVIIAFAVAVDLSKYRKK